MLNLLANPFRLQELNGDRVLTEINFESKKMKTTKHYTLEEVYNELLSPENKSVFKMLNLIRSFINENKNSRETFDNNSLFRLLTFNDSCPNYTDMMMMINDFVKLFKKNHSCAEVSSLKFGSHCITDFGFTVKTTISDSMCMLKEEYGDKLTIEDIDNKLSNLNPDLLYSLMLRNCLDDLGGSNLGNQICQIYKFVNDNIQNGTSAFVYQYLELKKSIYGTVFPLSMDKDVYQLYNSLVAMDHKRKDRAFNQKARLHKDNLIKDLRNTINRLPVYHNIDIEDAGRNYISIQNRKKPNFKIIFELCDIDPDAGKIGFVEADNKVVQKNIKPLSKLAATQINQNKLLFCCVDDVSLKCK